jgi:putative hydrolase
MASRDPVADLRRIAFQLERANEATYRVRAFRSAAATVAKLPPEELAARAEAGTLAELSGVGDVTARCIAESLAGEEPVYLRRVTSTAGTDLPAAAAAIRAALRGDCHSHSDWSDGGSPIEEMALAAVELGHEYLVLTDHSPRLTVANGLSPARLRTQLDRVARLNDALPEGFRVLTGIEVDILDDGSLDQEDELLARLDVVVGSVHSKLRDESPRMTRRMVRAVANPHLDILGHMTGRKVVATGEGDKGHRGGRTRPPSTFDLDQVIAACLEHG